MRRYKFEDVEFNVTEEVYDYPLLIADNFLHEVETYSFANSILKQFDDDDVFIDVGGCLGLFSLLLNKGTAFCFEPSIENWALCKRNFELNPEKKIVLFNDAVADRRVYYFIQRLTLLQEGNNGSALPGQTKTMFGRGDKITTTLDDSVLPLLKENQKVRLLKTDTEGHDAEVLSGAMMIIQKFHPVLIVENYSPEWLVKIGYKYLGRLNNLNDLWVYEDNGTD